MKLTRHNGRSGKNGVYNPKHNDRRFNVEHSEHIDKDIAKANIYWTIYGGLSTGTDRDKAEQDYSFGEVEKAFYYNNYSDFVWAQNERNEKTRHTERNRTVQDLLENKKTCPEETIYQIGTMEQSVSPTQLAEIAAEFFNEMQNRFGSHVHILDWALHLDEATPHIHERHTFDALNKHGELCPQQEKALEELGIPLPDPDKKPGKHNNRKMTFDAECREMLFRICESHDIHLQRGPTYGGRGYLEKQDFIIERQKNQIALQGATLARQSSTMERQSAEIGEQKRELSAVSEKVSEQREILSETETAVESAEQRLESAERFAAEKEQEAARQAAILASKQHQLQKVTMKVANMEKLVDDVAQVAYTKACEVVTDTVREETRKADVGVIERHKRWLASPERKADQKLRDFAIKHLDQVLKNIGEAVKEVAVKVTNKLQEPERRVQNVEQVKATARRSLHERLAENQAIVDQRKAEQAGRQAEQPRREESL